MPYRVFVAPISIEPKPRRSAALPPLTYDNASECDENKSALVSRLDHLEQQMGIEVDRDLSLSTRIYRLEKHMGIVYPSLTDRVLELEHRWTTSRSATLIEQSPMPIISNLRKDDDDDDTTTITRADSDEYTFKYETNRVDDHSITMNLPYGIYPSDSWAQVWDKLKQAGWRWKKGTGLKAFYFIKPGCAVKGGKEGVDYWTTEEDIQNYLADYGWKGRRNIHSHT